MNPRWPPPIFVLDDKSQIQALDRTAPMLPMLRTAQRATHDYEHNGSCDVIAALDMPRARSSPTWARTSVPASSPS